MALLGKLIHRAIRLRSKLNVRRLSPIAYQRNTLHHLLSRARDTAFGRHYDFAGLLGAEDAVRAFQERVPIHDYDAIHDAWWRRTLEGEADITWPGETPYFALSSGTSGAPSKHIPVSKAMVKAIQRAGIKQIYSLAAFNLPDAMFQKAVLILGGSTQLTKQKTYYVGDLSGISAAQIPSWFQHFYKPGPQIAAQEDWNQKLDAITRSADEWDVGIICGVPAWVQLLLQRIIDHYGVDTIHDVWPNLSVYVHGGVAFDPYRKALNALVARPLVTIETYIASEGYVAFQPRPNTDMAMLLNNGIFFEFVPFDARNFDAEGRIVDQPETRTIDAVEEGTPYALLMSTCAGAWRYLIGDVIQFTDTDEAQIVITGRTQHFLNLCGEHLSVINMVEAVQMLEEQLGLAIPEFTVAGVPSGDLFTHHWFLGTETAVDRETVRRQLDANLQVVNHDYGVKRRATLQTPIVEMHPVARFYRWMERRGKLGGQNKFPRVLNANQLTDWRAFLDTQHAENTR